MKSRIFVAIYLTCRRTNNKPSVKRLIPIWLRIATKRTVKQHAEQETIMQYDL